MANIFDSAGGVCLVAVMLKVSAGTELTTAAVLCEDLVQMFLTFMNFPTFKNILKAIITDKTKQIFSFFCHFNQACNASVQ